MALPLLVGGAECGPINPLQSLGKRFDQDRGAQQDHFGAGHAGSSRETFRTQTNAAPGFTQDAARFFATPQPSVAQMPGMPAFDLSALQSSLPAQQARVPLRLQSTPTPATSSWAADFMQQSAVASPVMASPTVYSPAQAQPQEMLSPSQPMNMQANVLPWSPQMAGYHINSMSSFSSTYAPMAQRSSTLPAAISWDKEFQSLEQSLASAPESISQAQEPEPATSSRTLPNDDLARTAALLIDAVRHEENPKFKMSQFMGLMRQLRDGEVTVEGNEIVEREPGMVSADVKGKGKARETVAPPLSSGYAQQPLPAATFARDFLAQQAAGQDEAATSKLEDENAAYFRQENEELMRGFEDEQGMLRERLQSGSRTAPQTAPWDTLQQDWDRFEATAVGIRPLTEYGFQANNPYVRGEASRTRHHTMHQGGRQAFLESVLELEAAVQRDPSNAEAWFELGVKQQENEREQKAIAALSRSLALDPAHLPAWLALAVSYTNEGTRAAAYDAIREWASRNPRYKAQVEAWKSQVQEDESQREKFASMIQCLIGLAASGGPEGELDADVQIALAVMLNINEEWEKSGDCFRTALAVRPDDWLLWNRVGATLANNGHADEALQYYNQAIELNPVYIRARYNIGIALINLRRYDEAAGHLLDALMLQDSDGTHSPDGREDSGAITSSSLWDSLKSACVHMHRLDLSTICERRDLSAFRVAFETRAP